MPTLTCTALLLVLERLQHHQEVDRRKEMISIPLSSLAESLTHNQILCDWGKRVTSSRTCLGWRQKHSPAPVSVSQGSAQRCACPESRQRSNAACALS